MDESTAKAIASQLGKPDGEDGIKTGKWMNQGNAEMNRDAIRVLHPSANNNILEIGMGNGFFAGEIVSIHPSIKYTGLDFSATMVNEAIKLNQQWIESGQVRFLLGAAGAMDFPDNSFDKIFTVNTLYFWENPPKTLADLKKILQPGGQLIIAIRPKQQAEKYPFTKHGFTLYSKEDLVDLLTTGGFSDIKTYEHTEPESEFDGKKVSLQNVIASATK
jgi:ubiquinone/menaquinone biosynthesis C-methylase UbiE